MVYITSDTNKGNFLQRFRAVDLTETDTLIVVGDTGLEDGYEGMYKQEWFESRRYTTFLIKKNDCLEKSADYIGEDEERTKNSSKIVHMLGGRIYVINNIRFLILNETTNLETVFADVDYVLVTKLNLLETVKNKIKYKQAYVSECDGAMIEDENIIVLNEKIVEIQSI